jgi:hypothetical protein
VSTPDVTAGRALVEYEHPKNGVIFRHRKMN